jgi:hypothetical protein
MSDLDHRRYPRLRVTRPLNIATDASVIGLRHFPETAHIPWTPSLKQRGTHDGHHSHVRT